MAAAQMAEDWTNPHGPIMSLEEHTAEVRGPGGGWSMSMWYDLGMLVNAWIGIDISIYGWLVVWNMNFISPNSWDDDPI